MLLPIHSLLWHNLLNTSVWSWLLTVLCACWGQVCMRGGRVSSRQTKWIWMLGGRRPRRCTSRRARGSPPHSASCQCQSRSPSRPAWTRPWRLWTSPVWTETAPWRIPDCGAQMQRSNIPEQKERYSWIMNRVGMQGPVVKENPFRNGLFFGLFRNGFSFTTGPRGVLYKKIRL